MGIFKIHGLWVVLESLQKLIIYSFFVTSTLYNKSVKRIYLHQLLHFPKPITPKHLQMNGAFKLSFLINPNW